jgi:hypothetical protein
VGFLYLNSAATAPAPRFPHCSTVPTPISPQGERNVSLSAYLVAPLHLQEQQLQQFPPNKFLPALHRLAAAHAALGERPDWLRPKGVGVVCVQRDGIKQDSFVHFYFGKMCAHLLSASGALHRA